MSLEGSAQSDKTNMTAPCKQGFVPFGWYILNLMEITARVKNGNAAIVTTNLPSVLDISTVSLKGWIESSLSKYTTFFLRVPLNVQGLGTLAEVNVPLTPQYIQDPSSLITFGLSLQQFNSIDFLLFAKDAKFRQMKNWVEFLADIGPVSKEIDFNVRKYFNGQPTKILSGTCADECIEVVISCDIIFRALAYARDRAIASIMHTALGKEPPKDVSVPVHTLRFKSTSVRVSSPAKKKNLKWMPSLNPEEAVKYAFPKKAAILSTSSNAVEPITIEDGECIIYQCILFVIL